ncbi:hypothetical protein VIM7927_00433 [Vibrio mangrovi]|uniref:Uncharacterized protein n=2 Tax=Vibrio mangrovi TaxID=474394 RepID=A0A1Y6ING6_9VIBR|nr:hypothetical protein VIM7927_00433 [Vibrio mangrovi]
MAIQSYIIKVTKFIGLYILILLLISVGILIYKTPQVMTSISYEQFIHRKQLVLEKIEAVKNENIYNIQLLIESKKEYKDRKTHESTVNREPELSRELLQEREVPFSSSHPMEPITSPRFSGNHLNNEKLNADPLTEAQSLASDAHSYLIKLEASENVPLGDDGVMSVWLGKKEYEPRTLSGNISDTMIRETTAVAARVVPIERNGMTYKRISDHSDGCMLLGPEGTVDMFTFTASKAGNHDVSALVHFYHNQQCNGSSSAIQTEKVSVTVKVAGFWETAKNSVDHYNFVGKAVTQFLDWLMQGENMLLQTLSGLILSVFSFYFKNLKEALVRKFVHHEVH